MTTKPPTTSMASRPAPLARPNPVKPQEEKIDPVVPDTPYEELLRSTLFDPSKRYNFSMARHLARDNHIAEYGFVILTKETLDALADLLANKQVIEVGAGTGILSHCLSRRGVQMLASDLGGETAGNFGMLKVWQRDHEGDSLRLLPGHFDAVVLSWPTYDHPFGYQVLQAMRPGQMLILQGEGPGGCTANDDFFDELDSIIWSQDEAATEALNEHHLQFFGVHDRWSVWTKQGY